MKIRKAMTPWDERRLIIHPDGGVEEHFFIARANHTVILNFTDWNAYVKSKERTPRTKEFWEVIRSMR
jgi:hypothetical protein